MKLAASLFAVTALALGGSAFAAPAPTDAAAVQGDAYESAVAGWTSYQDVADWLRTHFRYDRARLGDILARTRESGPAGLLARSAGGTYQLKSGYCTDAAAFAIQSLNRINPDYRARYIFIKNRNGQPHHWVAGFMVDGRIMVMDYGAAAEWGGMNGVHGPYDSLAQYGDFITSLRIARFAPEPPEWRDSFPGQQD